ncbi:MAG: 1-(5-phosphoribosyl)-5-[(5-phosphoribosylamino)methylideneamino]imidazole-4-carboxamide isomerase [Oscillospiraceae bacterium]|nr:1-(5-phosphoribosyl)-5-[(5-phosphoribosylamino)methylideneamino]imidazole-4-carboxamide isomerase [Oscillospiraceae bacterium]
MIILPAIDLLDGKCVRLYKGEYSTAHTVAPDPFETIKRFITDGAEYIHLVDLNGAKDGKPVNHELLCELACRSSVPLEIGGGIRDMETVKFYIENGFSRVIIGSAALKNPEFVKTAVHTYGDKIAVGIDARNGYVSTSGWTENSQIYFTDFAQTMEKIGIDNIIFTDIERDGTLEGAAIERLQELKSKVKTETKITASGGVKDIEDIRKLKALDVYGVICGKSIYEGTLNLKEAILL